MPSYTQSSVFVLLSLVLPFVSAAPSPRYTLASKRQSNQGFANCNAAFLNTGLTGGRVLSAGNRVPDSVPLASDINYMISQAKQTDMCVVIASTSAPGSSNAIEVGMLLPRLGNGTRDWNERVVTYGNYAFFGQTHWESMIGGAYYGFATMSTNTGHVDPQTPETESFGTNRDKSKDWGHRAMEMTVPLGKAIVKNYYKLTSNSPLPSYYSGCSTGGRQGLRSIMSDKSLNTHSFDAILVGAPAWDWDHLMARGVQNGDFNLQVAKPQRLENQPNFDLIADAVMAQCDVVGTDIVRDNITSDMAACARNFNWNLIPTCPNDIPGSDCLTSIQKRIAQNMSSDSRAYEGFNLPSARSWLGILNAFATAPGGFLLQYPKYFLNDTAGSLRWTPNADEIMRRANSPNQRDRPGATVDDFAALNAYPGKIILYHGTADPTVPFNGSVRLWQGITAKDKIRFFAMPGMGHCGNAVPETLPSGIRAPWYIGGIGLAEATQRTSNATAQQKRYAMPVEAGLVDKTHDALQMLVAWAEGDAAAPDRITATAFNDVSSPAGSWYSVYRQRPVCAYPNYAVLKNPSDATDSTKYNKLSAWKCSNDS
jgi:feruloyl esterase